MSSFVKILLLVIMALIMSVDSVVLAQSASTPDSSQAVDSAIPGMNSAMETVEKNTPSRKASYDKDMTSKDNGEKSVNNALNKRLLWSFALGMLALIVSVACYLLLSCKIRNLREFQEKHDDERFERLYSELRLLKKELKDSETKMSSRLEALDKKNKQQESNIVEKKSVASNQSNQIGSPKKKQPVTYSIYVQPQLRNEQIVLIECGEEQKAYLPFKLNATDETAQVVFNEASSQYVLSDIETAILKYAECQLLTNSAPAHVLTKDPGRASKTNDSWILTKKPVLQIS